MHSTLRSFTLSLLLSTLLVSSHPSSWSRAHRHRRAQGTDIHLGTSPTLTLVSSQRTSEYSPLGCFVDRVPRLLSEYETSNIANDPASCIATCTSHGYSFAGVESGLQCFCGNSLSVPSGSLQLNDQRVPDEECSTPCPGNPASTCGGAWRMQVFQQSAPDGQPEKSDDAESGGRLNLGAPDTPGKFVVAHFMVGNTHPYGPQDWLTDIRSAASIGIDAFALNVGRDGWQPDRVRDAFAAASGTNFKLFMSFDMTSLPCGSPSDADQLRSYISSYGAQASYLKDLQGRAIVSTFAGEYCTFGRGDLNSGWNYAVKEGLPPTSFIPSFFSDPQSFKNSPVMDGDFHWNGGWPMGNYDVSFNTDEQHISGLRSMPGGESKTYMAAVSPWFFTHYGPDTYNKNWIYKMDNHAFVQRWDILIQQRDRVGIAEIITWNDYGESHYIGRIAGDQPMSHAWVDGYDHQGWLELTQYYAKAFKSGKYPDILQDRIYLWARPHSKNANAPDHVSKPRDWEWTDDYLWAVLLAKSPGTLTLTSGSNSAQFNVATPGAHKFKVPSSAGGVSATLNRGGANVFRWSPQDFGYTDNPPSYNYNVHVAAGP